jgi:hypothetical protein
MSPGPPERGAFDAGPGAAPPSPSPTSGAPAAPDASAAPVAPLRSAPGGSGVSLAPGRARRRRVRVAHLRGALLALVLAVQGVTAIPVQEVSAERFERPDRRRTVERWSQRLGRVGVSCSPEALVAAMVTWSGRAARWRSRALAPFRPYFELTQTDQRWGLFLDANATRYRMHVEAREATKGWALRYRPLDPAARALAGELEYRRVRGVWNPRKEATRAPYDHFVDWVARSLFAREPGVTAVRVRMERFHIARPGEPPNPETSWHFIEVRRRSAAP